MKIVSIEDLHAAAGWRTTSFLKIVTDAGLVGWSEYSECVGNVGLTAAIRALSKRLIGQDPLRPEWLMALLATNVIPAWSGINQQATAAIGNALLDIKGKALGVPVHALFGGAVRDRLPVYWSHCGTYRVRYAKELDMAPLETLDDSRRLGREVRERGYRGLKTNLMMFENGKLACYRPGFGSTPGFPELNPGKGVFETTRAHLEALRDGAGPGMDIMLDSNFHFRTEGYMQLIRALDGFDLAWLEIDIYNPEALALLRREAPFSIASGESLYQRREYRPYLDAGAMDVAIIDVIWNGYLESFKMAAMIESYDVNIAPHNFYGNLADLISAHFAAAVPNLRYMEMDVDDVLWKSEFVTRPPVIENGEMLVPDLPGWGADVNEDAVRSRAAF